jgi:hypothetical protein
MLCYNVESKMLTKLIEVVVKDYQFYITANHVPDSPKINAPQAYYLNHQIVLFFYLIAKYLVILWNVSVIVVFVISFVYRHYRHLNGFSNHAKHR